MENFLPDAFFCALITVITLPVLQHEHNVMIMFLISDTILMKSFINCVFKNLHYSHASSHHFLTLKIVSTNFVFLLSCSLCIKIITSSVRSFCIGC